MQSFTIFSLNYLQINHIIGIPHNQQQIDLFKTTLFEQLNPDNKIYHLAQKFPWGKVEKKFRKLYSHTGQPAHTIRRMVGLTLLQRIKNLSDKQVVEQWSQNPYYQFLCGEAYFQWKQPCAPSDLTHFRKRIGKKGAHFLFKLSIELHQDKIQNAKQLIVDTTVQEKNITYPVDGQVKGRKSRSGKRSSIEVVISHLKHDHGLSRSDLRGSLGDVMNGLRVL